MAVVVTTTFTITPSPKTLAGYKTALQALIDAGAPSDANVSISTDGAISITVADNNTRVAIQEWVHGLIGDAYPS